jgi:transposase-like protein
MSQPSLPRPLLYKGYRFPPEIISHCVWLHYRFGVSLCDVWELTLARGIEVSYEAIRLWTLRFGLGVRPTPEAHEGRLLEHSGTSMNSV